MGSEDATGTGKAVEQEILGQHRCLDEQFAALEDALRVQAAPEDLRDRYDALRESLDQHFEQEDALYYPTIASLRPEHHRALSALTAEHGDFRRHMKELDEALSAGDTEGFRRGFARLARDFGRHEKEEERVLSALDREIAAAP